LISKGKVSKVDAEEARAGCKRKVAASIQQKREVEKLVSSDGTIKTRLKKYTNCQKAHNFST
jgi:hypothetical protein